jgi:3-oxoacyl-[acyl-carrier protein] reductase
MQLFDRVAVITGGASGIGRALCRQLAEGGIRHIGVVDMNEAANDVAAELNDDSGREVATPFVGDTTDRAFRKGVFAQLTQEFGAVHICVPAAGIVRDGLAVKVDKATKAAKLYDQDQFEKTLAVNLTAPVYWAMECIASIAESRAKASKGGWAPDEGVQGAVVFIGSISSAGNKGQVAYASTKAGLQGAQSTLAKEAIYYGVRCAIVHPGFTDTPMVRAMGEEIIRDHVLPHTQLRRLLRPEEVADAICFLIRNSGVSGALWVDAGWHPPA